MLVCPCFRVLTSTLRIPLIQASSSAMTCTKAGIISSAETRLFESNKKETSFLSTEQAPDLSDTFLHSTRTIVGSNKH